MVSKLTWPSLAVTLTLAVAACGDDSEATPDGAADAPADAAAVDAALDAPPGTIRLTGTIIDSVYTGVVEGVTVSVIDHPEIASVTTDTGGKYELAGVPTNTDLVVRHEKDQFVPMVSRVLHTGEVDYPMENGHAALGMLQAAVASTLAGAVGESLDPTKGFALVRVRGGLNNDYQPGFTFRIEPASGTVYYLNESDVPQADLTSTTTSGAAVFMNVDPGTVALHAEHPTMTSCTTRGPDFVYPMILPIVAGTETFPGSVICNEP